MGIPHSLFDERLEQLKAEKGVELDTDLTAADLKDLVEQYKNVYVESKGEKFPEGIKSPCHENRELFGFQWYNCKNVQRFESYANHLAGYCVPNLDPTSPYWDGVGLGC